MYDQYISTHSWDFFLAANTALFLAQTPQVPKAKCAYLKFHGVRVANLIINHIQFNKLYFCETLELFGG